MLTPKQQHLRLLQEAGTFEVRCSHAIFSTEELEVLQQHGHWMAALAAGDIPPLHPPHEAFMAVAQGQRSPVSLHEKAWFKYQGRTRLEAEKGDALKIEPHALDDSFYSRAMVKQLRSGMRKTLGEAHRA
jgi:uncharacterized protein YifE (UPF0438 family)